MSDIHLLPTKEDEILAALAAMKRALPAYAEMADVIAQLRRAHYDAYLAQGFTEEQALILCQKVTP